VTWVLVVAVVVLTVLLMRSRRSQESQKDFGPEYGRVRGDRREAESELAERRERRAKLEIRDLLAVQADPGL
jgi:hypothetical protein